MCICLSSTKFSRTLHQIESGGGVRVSGGFITNQKKRVFKVQY